MFGCGLAPNTTMHGVEELVEPPYLFDRPIEYRLVHADGSEPTMHAQPHNFAGWRQRYDRLGPLLENGGMVVGKVHNATVHVMDSPMIWKRGYEALQSDELFFVEKK